MKIPPSSPYAAFSAKEWRLATHASSFMNSSKPIQAIKKYSKYYKENQMKKIYLNKIQKPEIIQLSLI